MAVTDKIELSEILNTLRDELLKTAKSHKKHPIRFLVEEAEVELEFGVTKEASAGAGVKFWVYNADGEMSRSSTHTQRLKLKLTPRSRDGKSVMIDWEEDAEDDE